MSHQPKLTAENQTELEELEFTLEAFQGQFLLIFAQCNYDTLRSRLIQLIQESSPLDIHTITLHPHDTALYQRIQKDLQGQQPQALMVLGLESVQSLEKMLASADLVREEFRNNCPFPVVVWVTDSVKSQWMQFARNLESWGVSSQFNLSLEELVRFIQDKAAQCLEDGLDLTKTKWLELQGELEAAAAELQLAESALAPAIAAALYSLLGICHKQQADYQKAIDYLEQALVGWQELHRWDYQGLVLTEIVDAYFCQSNQMPLVIKSNRQQHQIPAKVKDYLQQALTAFNQAQRPDLIADALGVFGEVLRELQDWEQLQDLAQQALAFDQGRNRPDKLAIDYLFLADVALAQERWQEARKLAETALKYTKQSLPLTEVVSRGEAFGRQSFPHRQKSTYPNASPNPLGLQSRCYWILAQSYRNLGQLQAAIAQLESAHNLSTPLTNPRLYLEILCNLNELYWQTKDYLPAFKIKQEQQTVETQLGLRAFIGASRIPSPVGTIGGRVHILDRAHVGAPLLAPEITASGREKDVRELVERVIRNDCKVIVIHGFSGVGKSSLVNAGLVPTLRQTTASGQCIIPILIQVYADWLQDIGQQLTAALARQQIQITQPLDSNDAILEALRQTEQQLHMVLIFDQFEEFFFVVEQEAAQNQLFRFLGGCLEILSLKVIFSLRRDYLHYLVDRPGMSSISNNILSKEVLYPITNFTTAEAHSLIEQLTTRSHFKLESALIEQLVEDLAGDEGKVRPIELQVVGAQLQAEEITTLVDYQRSGTKEELVLRYLAAVVQDCGEENQPIAELLLYFLTDEKERRLLKTRAELAAELKNLSTVATSQLDLILEILVLSGLVFAIPDTPDERYQLVHDYLVSFIRQQQEPKTLAQLNQKLKSQREQILLQNLQLMKATRLKSQFLATMSNELRAPVNAVIGFSQLLLRQRQNSLIPLQVDIVQRILNNGKNSLTLINEIFDLYQIEAGRLELKLEKFNLVKLLRATVEELCSLAEEKNLELDIQADLQNPNVSNDSVRLRQILVNLLSNAIKFTECGKVQVKVKEISSEHLVIIIKDTGIGIAQEDLEHIFEAFWQIDQTTTRKYSGTGLGLAITELLVQLMQGTITVESQLGVGSTFRVELPRQVPADAPCKYS
ncbi:MAG: AAA family ATPase [Symploca sp. SIO1C2]|nr:AAA family ATPase [Symploca sp. SIO1C2]